MPKVTYENEISVEASPGNTILHISLGANLPHVFACGGNARCSTCRVLITDGLQHCSERNDAETAVADRLKWPHQVRLACQTQIAGDVTVRRMTIDDHDKELAENQMREGVEGAIGSERHIVAMFTDVRNYTPFVEQHLPYDVLHVLQRIYNKLEDRVREYSGEVNNYMGDGMVALFGLGDRENPELDAVRAGVAMLADIEKLESYFRSQYNRDIKIGVGIDCGSAVLGTIGTGSSTTFTAIGAPMNKAARLESATKLSSSNMLISDSVHARVRDHIKAGPTHEMELKGVPGLSTAIEVQGLVDG